MTYLHHIDDLDVLQYPSLFLVFPVLFENEIKIKKIANNYKSVLKFKSTGEMYVYEAD